MADTVLIMIYFIMYAVEIFLIGEGIFHNRTKEIKKYIAAAGAYLLIMIPAVLFFNHYAAIMLTLNFFLYIALFQGTFFTRIAHFICVYLIINMTESLIFRIGSLLLNLSSTHYEINPLISGMFSLFFAIVITVLLLFIVNRKWAQNFVLYFHSLSRFQCFIIILIIWSGILLPGVITLMPEYIGSPVISTILSAFAILFTGAALTGILLFVFLIYHKEYYLKQNKMKEKIIRVQQKYYQNIHDNDMEMRRFRHDIHAQLKCLGLLLADGQTQKALEHLQRIEHHFEELTMQKYHTGNEILDVILNQKILEAKKKDIHITVDGRLDKPDFMDSYHLCTLFSNMLDNCIEACEAMPDANALITVSILTHRNTVLFQFTNPATIRMYEAVKSGRTTKADCINHGFGMENIQRALYENNGETDCLFQDGKLITDFYFEM
ncbi:MAG: GHKL domain-containing protein [Lachnospiraceae bacterium]|nr:GHKL domain-containing protein [Lachnospiraceae bacterium]